MLTTKLFPLKGKVQNYAWGGDSFIPQMIGIEKEDKPYAEYWMGAHDNAPAQVGEDQQLNTMIKNDPSGTIGSFINDKFGRLPFLFKVLDVKDVLSIQVHPTKIEAEKGFARENAEGIPVTASHRNYKDDNHKPEIMVALSEFWLLHGFLPKAKLVEVLKSVPEFNYLLPVFEEEGFFGLYKTVMEYSAEEVNTRLKPLVDRVMPLYNAGKLDKASPDYWTAKSVALQEDGADLDKGIYSIYFFNIVRADIGDAIFQDAGLPHAYMEGQNMELMANSDNVLRGGLTPKHIDVPELLKHVTFEETHPNIMKGELQEDGLERIYKSPAPDFELSRIAVSKGDVYISVAKTAQIIIVSEGEATVEEGATTVTIKRGEVVVLLVDANYKITTSTSAVLFKATAPVE
ncbi:mannose-6-phosphate isomerase, class I [Flammeovirga kamogawensis]|uniref:mannose-6-phosphate isomerase n=1 Tax=Flammeovirga kamogawensis TaxID=373891 RepID=A0ABX8GU81_9BACT|nr:mannose-6-phosphate isomerase, class I [Flammeovirga kamogawensis]MBB6459774.1 mannose-6-phosphate isomerase [Flammeovirga kamogawensis]QWG07168.1 mannose-6-phosphate isomerase, class I [Flammeovirga kamogawensis]TRX68990.1 mannose-6-phosphate isomerase, class I [Flammeovirga kamogawensis]